MRAVTSNDTPEVRVNLNMKTLLRNYSIWHILIVKRKSAWGATIVLK